MKPMIAIRKVWDHEWFKNLLAIFFAAGVFSFIAFYDFSESHIASETDVRGAFEQLLGSYLDLQTTRAEPSPNWRVRDLGDGRWELNVDQPDQEGGKLLIARAKRHRKSGWNLTHLEIGNARSWMKESPNQTQSGTLNPAASAVPTTTSNLKPDSLPPVSRSEGIY
jgi:hypothetical protein